MDGDGASGGRGGAWMTTRKKAGDEIRLSDGTVIKVLRVYGGKVELGIQSFGDVRKAEEVDGE